MTFSKMFILTKLGFILKKEIKTYLCTSQPELDSQFLGVVFGSLYG